MKKILCVVLCAAMLCSMAALFAGCGKADAGEVNVYNWGEYIAEGQDGLMNVIDSFGLYDLQNDQGKYAA